MVPGSSYIRKYCDLSVSHSIISQMWLQQLTQILSIFDS